MKEQYLAKCQQGSDKIHLMKITEKQSIKYQVWLNRKRVYKDTDELKARRAFVQFTQNLILQLKIF